MALGYVVAQITVTDPERYPDYVRLVQPTLDVFGGEFLVRGGKSERYEGTPPGKRTVVIKFPSYQAAQDWYHSDIYKDAKALRQSVSTSVQTIVEGVD